MILKLKTLPVHVSGMKGHIYNDYSAYHDEDRYITW